MSISIDTIHILLPNQELPALYCRKGTVDLKTGELTYSEGYFACIKVRQFGDYLKIECSLPKLLKRENFHILSYTEILDALKMIETDLGISISDGNINRIDMVMQGETAHSAKNYFRYLSQSKNYKTRMIVNETSLYYKNKISRDMYFYDKIEEILSRKERIPIEFKNKNITRIEARYKKYFLKNLFGRDLKVIDLYNPDFFLKLVTVFFDDYKSIHKENKLFLDFSKIASKRNLLLQLANVGIQSLGGTTEVLEMMEASRSLNSDLIRPEYFSRRKADIKEISNSTDFVKSEELAEELNSIVENAYLNTINDLTNIKSIL